MMQQSRPHLWDLYEDQTEQMPAFLKNRPVLPDPRRNTEPLLPLDEWCRPYLISSVKWDHKGLLWDDTVCQVIDLVKLYHKRSHSLPTEIVLSAQRYFVRRCERFYPSFDLSLRPIPFKYEDADAKYEIIVRGIV